MKSFIVRYQTSSLIPAPFAHSIEILIKITDTNTLTYQFDLGYLDRDSLSEEEILEEGFSTNDDLLFSGILPACWAEALNKLVEDSKKTFPAELEENQEFWEVGEEKAPFYPKNIKPWKTFVEEFQQAVLEQNQIEKPLDIKIVRKEKEKETLYSIQAYFENRTFQITKEEKTKMQPWGNLNLFLKNIFSGDYDYDKSQTKIPERIGLFVNLGDEKWFEVGKSLLIKPSKITSWLDEQ